MMEVCLQEKVKSKVPAVGSLYSTAKWGTEESLQHNRLAVDLEVKIWSLNDKLLAWLNFLYAL